MDVTVLPDLLVPLDHLDLKAPLARMVSMERMVLPDLKDPLVRKQTMIFNYLGPAGPAGPAGKDGLNGAVGPAGPPGPAGE